MDNILIYFKSVFPTWNRKRHKKRSQFPIADFYFGASLVSRNLTGNKSDRLDFYSFIMSYSYRNLELFPTWNQNRKNRRQWTLSPVPVPVPEGEHFQKITSHFRFQVSLTCCFPSRTRSGTGTGDNYPIANFKAEREAETMPHCLFLF